MGCLESVCIFDIGIDRAPCLCRGRRTVHSPVSFFRIFDRLSRCCRLDFMDGPPTRPCSLFLPAIGYSFFRTRALAFHWEWLVIPVDKTDSTIAAVADHCDNRWSPDFCPRRIDQGFVVCMVRSYTLSSISIFIILLMNIQTRH